MLPGFDAVDGCLRDIHARFAESLRDLFFGHAEAGRQTLNDPLGTFHIPESIRTRIHVNTHAQEYSRAAPYLPTIRV